MPAGAVDLLIVAGSLGLFGLAYAVARLATRPARPPAAPASPDLGDEPPAVVQLLANRWRLTEDAAEATLLDLAARRVIELRQPAGDPMQTTIHVRAGDPGALLPYERRVLDRVRGLAVGGVVPVTALTFRNQRQARTWNRRLRGEVVAEARASGLSQRRFGTGLLALLGAIGMVTVAGLVLAMLRYAIRDETTDLRSAIAVGFFGLGLLAWLLTSPHGERDTAAGRAAAARWLGVRDWLRGHEEFADLPPAAVAVWDRYLPYGAALGVTHTASQVLDLGMGDRRLVWSAYGGRWRRVRVRYPRFWAQYGRGAASLLVGALLSGLAGGLLVRFHRLPGELDPGLAGADRVVLVAGWLLLLRAGYRVVRTVLDLATTRTVTGEVLWLEVWRTRSQGKNRPRVPWLHYLAVDGGSADRTTAWGLPHGRTGPGCRDGDTVTVRVRPWSRRVVELTLVERGRAHRLGDQPAADEVVALPAFPGLAALGRAAFGAVREPPRVDAGALLTPGEVGQAFGLLVREPERVPMPGFVATATFRTADRSREVLLVQVADGVSGRLTWRANQRGTELPGIGDGARLAGNRAALRVGETTLLLTLLRDAKGRHAHLPWLMQQAAARIAPEEGAPDRAPA